MKRKVSTRNACLLLAIVCFLPLSCAAQNSLQSAPQETDVKSRVAGLQKKDGFFPYYWDEKKGKFLLELSPPVLDREFLYFTALGSGVGSTEMFADRSSFGASMLCRFRRAGMRVLVIQENTSFRAPDGSLDLKHSVASSFPVSVLAALPVEAEEGGTVLVNANSLLLRDAFDLLSQLRRPTQAIGGMMIRGESSRNAGWKLDEARSIIDFDYTGTFPMNTEVEALLTFASEDEADLNQPDPHTISVREHHSFVALPPPGYAPREQDVRVGFFGESFQDFSRPFNLPITRGFIDRWRIEKKDPNAALSEPVKPLVFYLDRAIPEPIRSAARRGALWWNAAFEQAGFKDAIRIEDLPEGANPLDIRYPTIQWTNRSGRGWSVGQSHADPRTGEIIHAVVQLDSHRMRTANNYWRAFIPSNTTPSNMIPPSKQNAEPALDDFAEFDHMDPKITDEQVMLNRVALLTCHEMGHVFGLEHNFLASTFNRGSVMDYFAPRVKIRADGSADLSDAYMQGTGSYDRFAIEWGYSQDKPADSTEQRKARLDAIVKESIAKGIVWSNYDDPRWNAYDDGPDPVTWLKEVVPVRDALLLHYGPQMLRPGEPSSMLASRFPLVYLFHRYALAAAINVVGSAKIPPSLDGDGQVPIAVWPVESQKEAVRLLLQALTPAELDVPASLWKHLAPAENNDHDAEQFKSSAGYLFSPQDGARAVSEIVVPGLLNPERMERLAVLAHVDKNAISADEVVAQMVEAGFSLPAKTLAQEDLLSVVRSEIAENLMILAANPEATAEVQAAALAGVQKVQAAAKKGSTQNATLRRLDHEITLFLLDPKQNTPKVKGSGAPPGPPV